jgi:Uma2 family endonuclease
MSVGMATDPLYQPITVEEFLTMDFGTDRKFELSNGVIQMMTGGTETHAWVQSNVAAWLRVALRGSGCRSYGSEMGIRISETDVRYPDVSVHCGSRPEHGANVKALATPIVVIEVLSPSTATYDQGTKLEEYKALPSVELVGFIDPVNELVRSVRRIAPSGWLDRMFSASDLELTPLGLVIPHAEIFARD